MLLLVLSLVLGLIPLLGIVLIVLGGWIATVDGLFTSLILAAMSGIFFLNALLELRARGLVPGFRRAQKPAPAAPLRGPARPAGPAAPPPPAGADGVVTEIGTVESVSLYEMPVGQADRSLVAFRAQGSPAPRSMVFNGNVQHLRPGHRIRISYKPSPDGNVLVGWE